MNKIYYLSTCSTCTRIMKELKLHRDFNRQDIKTNKITSEQLEEMHKLSGSYESLFSKAALKYRALDLHEQKLTEQDYRHHILEEYTFLKRPVLIIGNQIFIGNEPKTIAAAKEALKQ